MPDDYYVSQYSGEEIDALLGKAGSSVQVACNPNLLDNWYFGNPVDQRGGHISLQGVPVYNDSACTSFLGNQIEPAVTCIKNGDNYERRINSQGGGFVKAADVVRGYTGAGYGIDRWYALLPDTVVTVQSDHVSIAPPASDYFGWTSLFEAAPLLGQTVTFSALCRYTGNGGDVLPYITAYMGDNQYAGSAQINQTTWQCISFTITFPTTKPNDGRFGLDVVAMQNFGVDIKAAKLELGSQQTLAHQDADGNWVLNEVPNYGEQLRRCQRYFYQISYGQYQTINMAYEDTAYAFLMLPLPVEMRIKNPVVTQSAPIALGTSEKTLTGAEVSGCMARLAVNYDAIANPIRACYSYCPSASGVTFTLSADL